MPAFICIFQIMCYAIATIFLIRAICWIIGVYESRTSSRPIIKKSLGLAVLFLVLGMVPYIIRFTDYVFT